MGIIKTISQAIGKNISKNVEKTGSVGKGLLISSQQLKTVSNVVGIGTAAAVLNPAGTLKVVGSAGKALIPKSVGGLVGTTALIGLGSTKGGRTLIKEGVKGIFKGAKATGETYEDIVSGNKEFTGKDLLNAGIGGGLLTAGALVIPDLLNKDKDKDTGGFSSYLDDNTLIPDTKKQEEQLQKEVISGVQPNAAVESPVLPETQTISSTPAKKRKKMRSKPRQQQINQRVNIDIINNNSSNRTTKKYINAIALR